MRGLAEAIRSEPVEKVGDALQSGGVAFYAIGFSEHLTVKERKDSARKALDVLARASGGLVVNGDAKDLASEFARIRNDISAQYILGFPPTT